MLANRDGDLAFWRALEAFDPARLDAGARRWAGERWAERAQMEHASIASFAKFSLQLVMVAAPPALLADAHDAAVDEIHHARVGFAPWKRGLPGESGRWRQLPEHSISANDAPGHPA
jgi:hypothetical protein